MKDESILNSAFYRFAPVMSYELGILNEELIIQNSVGAGDSDESGF